MEATEPADVEHMGFPTHISTYILDLNATKKGRHLQKKIYGQTYKNYISVFKFILTIFTIVCGTFFIHLFCVFIAISFTFMPAFSFLFNFDFVLRNGEDLVKKALQADFCMT